MERRRLKFGLRDYQGDANSGINRIFEREDHNRFAGVVLPTGGGKSFVAISQLMTFGKKDKENIEIDENGMINDANMLYVAPRHEILNQVKLHFVKNVLLNIDGIENMSISEIDNYLKNNLAGVNFPGINTGLGSGEIPTRDDANAKEKINAILRRLTIDDIDMLVTKAFPNLKFCCYAGVKDGETLDDKDILNADFIITDEAHRLGASKWGKNFFENLRKNRDAKLLAITATPDRTDAKAKNMFAEIAREIYPEETITPDVYMSQEIYVMDAMRDGIVLAPEVNQTNATLATSDQYNQILDSYNKLPPDDPKRAIFEEALDEMEEIIGFSPRKMTPKQLEKTIREAQKDLITQSIANKNGKYIAFIPPNAQKDLEKPDSAEYLKEWKKRIIDSFKGVLDENGKPVKVTVSILTSNPSIMLDGNGDPIIPEEGKRRNYTKIDNSQIIKDFEDASNESGGIKIVITNDILNEGVHVDGIDGSIMFRTAGSSTIYLQQSGRCISSLDPDKPLDMQPSTQIIDACGNSFSQTAKGTGRKSSVDYDLKRVEEIVKWIDEHGQRYPDVNSVSNDEDPKARAAAEAEARMALSIKRIQRKYGIYFNNHVLPLEDRDKVASLLKAAEAVSLFTHQIPERTVEPSEAELTGEGFLTYTEDQKRFMSIYDRVRAKELRMTSAERINKLIGITRILKMYKSDIEFPQGILVTGLSGGKNNTENVISKNMENLTLDRFLRENFDEETIQKILVDLKNYDLMQTSRYSEIYHDGETYDLGKEMAFVRGKIYTSMHDMVRDPNYSLFDKYEMKDLIALGIIRDGKADIQTILDMDSDYQFEVSSARAKKNGGSRTVRNAKYYVDDKGRVKRGFHTEHAPFGMIDKFEDCSVTTGEQFIDLFDRDGYAEDSYDIEGFNRFGFDRRGIHRTTHSQYDERGFYFDDEEGKWLNRHTGEEYDLLGHNIYGFTKDGFERPVGPAPVDKSSRFSAWKYIKPLWHLRLAVQGAYSKHGYEYRERHEPKEKPYDANGFIGEEKHRESKNPRYDKSNGDGYYFRRDGATRKTGTGRNYQRLDKKDFYIDGLDIDEYSEDGFKKVKHGDKTIYIHRDTSATHDRKGRIAVVRQRQNRRGEVIDVISAVEDPKITKAKQFIHDVLGGNMPIEVAIRKYAKENNENVGTTREAFKRILKEAFTLYRYECPEAFDESDSFKGLESYYLTDIGSKEKRERLDEFFRFCPTAKELLVDECKSNDIAIRRIQRIKNLREAQLEGTKGLTREEQAKKQARLDKQAMFDQLGIEDRE